MPEEQVLEGLSKGLEREYALSVGVMKEGGIVITEAYDAQIVGSRKAENIPLT